MVAAPIRNAGLFFRRLEADRLWFCIANGTFVPIAVTRPDINHAERSGLRRAQIADG